jgi:hypothetical protein
VKFASHNTNAYGEEKTLSPLGGDITRLPEAPFRKNPRSMMAKPGLLRIVLRCSAPTPYKENWGDTPQAPRAWAAPPLPLLANSDPHRHLNAHSPNLDSPPKHLRSTAPLRRGEDAKS